MANHRIYISAHQTPKQIKERYLKNSHVVEKSYWHILWLLTKKNSLSADQAAEVLGCTGDWIRKLVRRYNKEGVKGLEDKRKYNGNDTILTKRQQKKLETMIRKGRNEDGGFWTGPKVAQWMKQQLNRDVSAVTGWHYLNKFGFSLQVPRPCHEQSATPKEQAAFKKNSKIVSKKSVKLILKK